MKKITADDIVAFIAVVAVIGCIYLFTIGWLIPGCSEENDAASPCPSFEDALTECEERIKFEQHIHYTYREQYYECEYAIRKYIEASVDLVCLQEVTDAYADLDECYEALKED